VIFLRKKIIKAKFIDSKIVTLHRLVKSLNFGNIILNMKYSISEEYR